jgi:hypothetical protein
MPRSGDIATMMRLPHVRRRKAEARFIAVRGKSF